MNRIKVLIKGYAREGKKGVYLASPSTILIYHKNKKILVDPGANAKLLLSAFRKENIKVDDIDFIYLSHYHPDHFLNIRLFPNHDIYDGEMLWRKDKEFFHSKKIPDTDIEILPTPGHSPEHTSLLIKTADFGLVCIAQDVFWWEDGKQKSEHVEDLLNLKDPLATDLKTLKKSRQKILDIADWIVPGHGKMFKNPSKS